MSLVTLSHLSTHLAWNSCEQGSTLTSCRCSKSLMQTTHTVWVCSSRPASSSPPVYLRTEGYIHTYIHNQGAVWLSKILKAPVGWKLLDIGLGKTLGLHLAQSLGQGEQSLVVLGLVDIVGGELGVEGGVGEHRQHVQQEAGVAVAARHARSCSCGRQLARDVCRGQLQRRHAHSGGRGSQQAGGGAAAPPPPASAAATAHAAAAIVATVVVAVVATVVVVALLPVVAVDAGPLLLLLVVVESVAALVVAGLDMEVGGGGGQPLVLGGVQVVGRRQQTPGVPAGRGVEGHLLSQPRVAAGCGGQVRPRQRGRQLRGGRELRELSARGAGVQLVAGLGGVVRLLQGGGAGGGVEGGLESARARGHHAAVLRRGEAARHLPRILNMILSKIFFNLKISGHPPGGRGGAGRRGGRVLAGGRV